MATSNDKASETSTQDRAGQTETSGSAGTQTGTAQVEARASAGEQTVGLGVGMRAPLPSNVQVDPKRLLWFGGLVAVGALGVLEWPVVAAVGVGSYVAEQFAKSDRKQRTQTASAQ
ncbi:MAG: hypothetical protein ACLGIA_04635 [Actinomycetes bacterium]